MNDHHHGPGAHSHGHSHAPASVSPRTMGGAVVLTLGFVVLEGVAGWLGNSLALLSDAVHNLADAAALALSWYALVAARKPSHDRMTFGYHRVAVVAALVNSGSLLVVALWIVWEALMRLGDPELPNSTLMIGTALANVVVNTVISVKLHAGAKHDINVRSAYLHMVVDVISTLGVVAAGVVIAVTGASVADPVASIAIAAFIVWSSSSVLRDSTTVLLEGTPPGTDMPALIDAIKGVNGVLDVHDLHVWMVGPGVVACSCHIVVAEQSVREGQQVLRAVVAELARRFQITHTTVQVEVEGCEANEMYCGRPVGPHRAGT